MSNSKPAFTARENEVLALAWLCFQTDPKVDIKKLASLTGYTHSSASTTLAKLKARMKQHALTVGVDAAALTAPSGRAKKRAVRDDDDDEVGRTKKRGKKARKGGEMVGEEMGLCGGNGGAEEMKIKDEREDMGVGWGAGVDVDEEEV